MKSKINSEIDLKAIIDQMCEDMNDTLFHYMVSVNYVDFLTESRKGGKMALPTNVFL